MTTSLLSTRFAPSPLCARPPRASCASVLAPAAFRTTAKCCPPTLRSHRPIPPRALDGDQDATSVVVDEPRPSCPPPSGSADWEGFGAQVSGEWDGYSAEFNFAGEPIQLPSNIVPDAFRDWGVEIHDWQTQCPTLAHPDKGHLWYKVIRLHPTVGCEADAATVYGVEPCDVQQSASALVYHSSGSYTIVWRGKRVTRENSGSGPGKEVSRAGDEIEVEQCLVHERKRIRVLQHLDPRRRVMVFREAWEGPFRNGESLGGCAIGTPAFATQIPLQPSALIGTWRTDLHSAENLQHHQEYTSSELVSSGMEDMERQMADTVLYLPKDTWTSLSKSESGGTVVVTGWLAKPDQAIVSICEFGSSGDLKGVSLRLEKRISGE